MKYLMLTLAILGTVVPYIFFLDFLAAHAVVDFIPALFVNGAAGGFSADLLITSFAFWCYLWHKKEPYIAGYVAANLLVGLSLALPLYLFLRSRPT